MGDCYMGDCYLGDCSLALMPANCHVKRICITRGEQREERAHYIPTHGRLARVLSNSNQGL